MEVGLFVVVRAPVLERFLDLVRLDDRLPGCVNRGRGNLECRQERPRVAVGALDRARLAPRARASRQVSPEPAFPVLQRVVGHALKVLVGEGLQPDDADAAEEWRDNFE